MKLFTASMFLLFIAHGGSLYGQKQGQALIDSLVKELGSSRYTRDDTDKVKVLKAVSFAYFAINPDEGIKYGKQDLELAEKLNWQKGIAYANNTLGLNYQYKSEYATALKYYQAAVKKFEDINYQKGLAQATGNIGVIYYNQNDQAKALEYYLKQLKIYEQIGEKLGIGQVTGNIGLLYVSQSDYPMALEYLFRSLKIAEETGNKKGCSNATGNIGLVYVYQSAYPKALEFFLKKLKIDEELGDKNGMATVTGNIGVVYHYQGDEAKALEYHLKSLKIYEETGNRSGVADADANIGIFYVEQKNYARALEYYFRGYKISAEIGYKKELTTIAGNIGVVYYDIGDYRRSLGYDLMALKIAEEIGDKERVALDLNNVGSCFLSMDTARSDAKMKIADDSLPKENILVPPVNIPAGKAALLHTAISYLERALATGKEISSLDRMQSSYEHLSAAYELSGNYKKAMESYRNYTANSRKIIQQGIQYDFDKKEAVAKVEQEKKDMIATKELQKQKLVRNGFMGGFAVVLLFAAVFFSQRNKIKEGKKQSDELLRNILPSEVAEELKEKGSAEAKLIDKVTVLFTDFKDFTALSERLSPTALVAEINDCFSAFDRIVEKYGVEKIKTIGDSYMAAGGLPTANKTHHDDVVRAALDIQEYMEQHKQKKEASGDIYFEIRIGVHTGPVVAGIVGLKKFQYDIWGDTVNTASRMESSGEVGKVNISGATYEMVKDKFHCEYRGKITAKGKGEIDMYYVS